MATLQPLHNCQGHQVWFPVVSSVVGVVGLEEAMMAMATLGFPEAGLPFRPASRLVPVPADWDTRRRKLPCLVSHSDIHCSVRPPNDDPWKRKEAHITPPA